MVVGSFQLKCSINIVKRRLLFSSDGGESTSPGESLLNSLFLIDYLSSTISFFIEGEKGREISPNKTCNKRRGFLPSRFYSEMKLTYLF